LEGLLFFLVFVFGLIGFLSPCTWNLNAILIANAREKGIKEIFYFFFFRILLFSLLGTVFFILGKYINLSLNDLIFIHFAVAGMFFFGNPLMKKFKFAPFDLSVQAFLPDLKLPAGIALGLNFPYCAFPFFVMVISYGLYLGGVYPLVFSFVFAFVSGIPTFFSFFLSKKGFQKINELIPSIPYISGFIVLITGFYLMNRSFFEAFSLFDFVNSKHSIFITVFVVFILGVLTTAGPATLPFVPVVAGILASNAFSRTQVFINVSGFTVAFVLSHILIGVVSFYGFMVVNQLFNVKVFNIILGVILFFVGFNLVGLMGFSLKLPRLKITQTGGFIGSFVLGTVYTFSICPSCTALLLGAVALSVATGNILLTVLSMVVYALGRSVLIFILGFLFNIQAVRQFIQKNYPIAKRFTGIIFIILSLYFIRKGM